MSATSMKLTELMPFKGGTIRVNAALPAIQKIPAIVELAHPLVTTIERTMGDGRRSCMHSSGAKSSVLHRSETSHRHAIYWR